MELTQLLSWQLRKMILLEWIWNWEWLADFLGWIQVITKVASSTWTALLHHPVVHRSFPPHPPSLLHLVHRDGLCLVSCPRPPPSHPLRHGHRIHHRRPRSALKQTNSLRYGQLEGILRRFCEDWTGGSIVSSHVCDLDLFCGDGLREIATPSSPPMFVSSRSLLL